MPKGGHCDYFEVLGEYFISHEKSDMYFKKGTFGSPIWQCYSYATCAEEKSTSMLMRSSWLDLAFTICRYLTDLQETNKCNGCFVTILNNIQVKYYR